MSAFPLLLLVLILYNLVAFGVMGFGSTPVETAEGVQQLSGTASVMLADVASVPMPSGDSWSFTYGDLFIFFGLILLCTELIRATYTRGGGVWNHAFSLVVLVVGLIEFIILPGFATSTFFFIVIMAGVDVIAGSVISIKSAQKDVSVATMGV